jgi:hypothetical protein
MNIEPGQNKEKKFGRVWNKRIVVFIVLPIILTILFPMGGLPYLCGRYSPYAITLAHFCILYPVIGVFIIYCFVRGFARLPRDLKKRNKKEKIIIVAQIGIPLVFLVLLVSSFLLPESEFLGYSYKFFMYGLKDRVRSKADTEDIRDWLGTLSDEYFIADHFTLIPSDEWSKSLKVLNPRRVYPLTDENSKREVRLMWGSGAMGHWGVVIGMEDMIIPSSDFSHYGEYRLPVEAGSYVWWSFE